MTPTQPPEAAGPPAASFAELSERRLGPVRRFLHTHPVAMDLLVCGGYLLLVGGSAFVALRAGHWYVAAAVAMVAVVLFFRRRHSMAVLATVALLETSALAAEPLHSAYSAGLWFALYTAATKYAGRRMFILVGLISAIQSLAMVVYLPMAARNAPPGGEAAAGILLQDPAIVWFAAALLLAANLAAVGIGASVRSNRLHDAELANWGLRVQQLAQTAERNRIAREMHDVVAHSLSVMIALSDGAAVVMQRDPDRALDVLRELSSTGRGALADMRRVIGVLRAGPGEAPLQPQPAAGSLEELLEGFRVAGLPLQFGQSGPPLPQDAAFQLTVYRIVQESLTNVLRYGREVSRVAVDIDRDGDTVRLKVADNGQLAGQRREAVGSGQGLKGIAERTAIYGGSVYAGPGPQGGWVVHAIMTVPAPAGAMKGEERNAGHRA